MKRTGTCTPGMCTCWLRLARCMLTVVVQSAWVTPGARVRPLLTVPPSPPLSPRCQRPHAMRLYLVHLPRSFQVPVHRPSPGTRCPPSSPPETHSGQNRVYGGRLRLKTCPQCTTRSLRSFKFSLAVVRPSSTKHVFRSTAESMEIFPKVILRPPVWCRCMRIRYVVSPNTFRAFTAHRREDIAVSLSPASRNLAPGRFAETGRTDGKLRPHHPRHCPTMPTTFQAPRVRRGCVMRATPLEVKKTAKSTLEKKCSDPGEQGIESCAQVPTSNADRWIGRRRSGASGKGGSVLQRAETEGFPVCACRSVDIAYRIMQQHRSMSCVDVHVDTIHAIQPL